MNYNFHRYQPFYNRGGRRLGFSCLNELFFMSIEKHFFHIIRQIKKCLYIHEARTIFQIFFFTNNLLVNSSRYLSNDALQGSNFTKRDEKSAYINQNNKNIYLPPISCVACIGNKFSKLYGYFYNYKETFMFQSQFLLCFTWLCIPAVLCHVLASTCSSILNVYFFMFFLKNVYLHMQFIFMIQQS